MKSQARSGEGADAGGGMVLLICGLYYFLMLGSEELKGDEFWRVMLIVN